jgi:hypothetical protein
VCPHGVELPLKYIEPAFNLGQERIERRDYRPHQCLFVLGEWPLFLHASTPFLKGDSNGAGYSLRAST